MLRCSPVVTAFSQVYVKPGSDDCAPMKLG